MTMSKMASRTTTTTTAAMTPELLEPFLAVGVTGVDVILVGVVVAIVGAVVLRLLLVVVTVGRMVLATALLVNILLGDRKLESVADVVAGDVMKKGVGDVVDVVGAVLKEVVLGTVGTVLVESTLEAKGEKVFWKVVRAGVALGTWGILGRSEERTSWVVATLLMAVI